jgi:hypothetical protein
MCRVGGADDRWPDCGRSAIGGGVDILDLAAGVPAEWSGRPDRAAMTSPRTDRDTTRGADEGRGHWGYRSGRRSGAGTADWGGRARGRGAVQPHRAVRQSIGAAHRAGRSRHAGVRVQRRRGRPGDRPPPQRRSGGNPVPGRPRGAAQRPRRGPAVAVCYAYTNGDTERLLRASGRPYSIVRASLFTEFFLSLLLQISTATRTVRSRSRPPTAASCWLPVRMWRAAWPRWLWANRPAGTTT